MQLVKMRFNDLVFDLELEDGTIKEIDGVFHINGVEMDNKLSPQVWSNAEEIKTFIENEDKWSTESIELLDKLISSNAKEISKLDDRFVLMDNGMIWIKD